MLVAKNYIEINLYFYYRKITQYPYPVHTKLKYWGIHYLYLLWTENYDQLKKKYFTNPTTWKVSNRASKASLQRWWVICQLLIRVLEIIGFIKFWIVSNCFTINSNILSICNNIEAIFRWQRRQGRYRNWWTFQKTSKTRWSYCQFVSYYQSCK